MSSVRLVLIRTDLLEQSGATNYIRKLEHKLRDRYLAVLKKKEPKTFAVLQEKIELQTGEGQADGRATKKHRVAAYIGLWGRLNEKQKFALSQHDAKLNNILRIARTIGTTEIVHAHNKIKTTTAGSIDFVIRAFREQQIGADQVQQYIDENAVAWFSLTGHPTNPTTVDYTAAQTRLARVIADPKATPKDLDRALLDIYETPIVGDRKSPLDEARETINTLNVIYDTALAHRALFEKALSDYGYAQEGVRINRPLIVPCAWTLGDADGNESLTADVLERGIVEHRKAIATRYAQTLQAISVRGVTDKGVIKDFEKLKSGIQSLAKGKNAAIKDTAALLRQIEQIIGDLGIVKKHAALKESLSDFAYLVKCFGLGFGTIDVRHNAVDVMGAVKKLTALAGIGERRQADAADLNQIQLSLTRWLKDDSVISQCSAITAEQIRSDGDETSATVFGRLQVIGKNPDMCGKLIVAETTHSAHALAALFLLKVTGNAVGVAGSMIDLTTLSESVRDLMSLGSLTETLLENETYRAHVASRGRIIAMIAKSDTTRQDGRGEAEYAQYEACVDVYRVGERMRRKYPELEDVKTSIMNGGGEALQRGGGRVTEVAAIHGRAASDARVTDCGPSTLTIQGQQLGILLCPGKVVLGTLEALAAQNLYSKAGVNGEMPEATSTKGMNRQYARTDAWLYAKTAGLAFEALTKYNPAIDNLLLRAPWLSMKAGNVSSRPGKRGEKMVGPGITPCEAMGQNPKALQGRAISGERLTAHACLPIFAVLGLLEAMETVRGQGQASRNPEKYGEALHHLYRTHKIHRDGVRATINAVPMADFDLAWPLLTGRERPMPADVSKLADQFRYKDADGVNTTEITLAFLEQYFLEVEKLSYEMITGRKANKHFHHGDGLKKLWPELYNEVASRDRGAEFARVIECHRAHIFYENADEPLSEMDFRITQNLYASCDVINAPVGILATRTRLEPVYEMRDGVRTKLMKPESFLEGEVANLLKIPASMRG